MTSSKVSYEEDMKIVAHYRGGASLRDCATMFDRSIEGIRNVLQRRCPKEIRPPYVHARRRVGKYGR